MQPLYLCRQYGHARRDQSLRTGMAGKEGGQRHSQRAGIPLDAANIQVQFVVLSREQARGSEAAGARKAEGSPRGAGAAQPSLPLERGRESAARVRNATPRPQSTVPPAMKSRSSARKASRASPTKKFPYPRCP